MAMAKQEGQTVGQVELSVGQEEVFIEIDSMTVRFNGAVLGILAHEISHKYLHRYGVSYAPHSKSGNEEEEALTDVTAAFLGLGKLMLNGCECQIAYEDTVGARRAATGGSAPMLGSPASMKETAGGRWRVTETYKAGYLSPVELAFTYRLVCEMRKIPRHDFERGLSANAVRRMGESREWYQPSARRALHGHAATEALLERTQSEASRLQQVLAPLDRAVVYLRDACAVPVEAWSHALHRRVSEARKEITKLREQPEHDPCLIFLMNLELSRLAEELHGSRSLVESVRNKLWALCRAVASQGSPCRAPSADMFSVVVCPNDCTKLRLPSGRPGVRTVCPKCRYEFVADTSIRFDEPLGTKLISSIRRLLHL